ncbi:hypothetical protein B0J11DRAFT_541919 [Dendryphion nanum]|uniref:FAD/NAD(P)-binding domain-containing protein n=1 Tax=Dendryphion nanum TaxID=256645 RepID=A0A9P9D5X1_9PLEO|nr:hypothetical protein B0J11DRAFT_541919 [Dendryphion nanum]
MACNSTLRVAMRSQNIRSMRIATQSIRSLATVPPVTSIQRNHKVVIIGGGSAGITVSHQLLRKSGYSQDDIAIVDPATWHHYQPGWTLVGGGLAKKEDLRRPLQGLMDPKFKFYNTNVNKVSPAENQITLDDGDTIGYEQLIVAPGITVDYGSVKGLTNALADPESLVSSIYNYDYCDKAFRSIEKLDKGNAIFTQPAGIVKCAGAPQKIMWLALDHWKRAGRYNSTDDSAINITFATGLPTMFGVPKYSAKLEELRIERGVEGLFQHNLIEVDGSTATFARTGQDNVKRKFGFLHVAPRNVPYKFISESGIGNEAGYVDVNDGTLQHTKYNNIWSLGDASSLPTSKTVAAITSQAPLLVSNLLQATEGKEPTSIYDGYTSCPLLTGENKVLLAEFKYGGVPKETFNRLLGIDQVNPRRAFYHLKKDFFPWVYGQYHVTGHWGGPNGFIR